MKNSLEPIRFSGELHKGLAIHLGIAMTALMPQCVGAQELSLTDLQLAQAQSFPGYNSPFQKRQNTVIARPNRIPDGGNKAPETQSQAQYHSSESINSKSRAKILHVLNRLTFGPCPGDIEKVDKMGIDAYIDQQLHPENIPEAQSILDFTGSSDALTKTPDQLYQEYGNGAIVAAINAQNLDPKSDEAAMLRNKLFGDFNRQVLQDTTKSKLMRAVESPRQLQEVMVEFWFNHFNVYSAKGNIRYTLGAYERQAIRPYALGNFKDLVEATCHHAAMMDYLDNSSNSSPRLVKGKSVGPGLNENYARELMELHTLGVDGGYSQQDVIELARILTGLTNAGYDGKTGMLKTETCDSGTYFNSKRHDFGDKVLLGQKIKGSGADEIEQALDILCKSPATAKHISFQLAQYFVADNPPPSLVKKLSSKFQSTNGDIKEVLKELFRSKEFMAAANTNNKFKSPFHYIVSVLRASQAKVKDYNRLQQYLNSQGEPLYGCLTPDGYKNVKDAWLNPDALVHRANFAVDFSAGRFNGLDTSSLDVRNIENSLGWLMSPTTQNAIDQAPPNLKAGLAVGSPDFMVY